MTRVDDTGRQEPSRGRNARPASADEALIRALYADQPLPAGRGRFLRRGEAPYLIQVAQD